MEAQDLRNKSVDELNEELVALRREQFNLRMAAASGEMSNTAEPKRVRRDIARIKTVLNELERANSDA